MHNMQSNPNQSLYLVHVSALCRSNDGSSCEIDVDFGPQKAQLSLLRMLIPASSSAISSSYAPKTQLQYLKLMASDDQVDWTELAVGSDAHPYATGWSEIPVNSTESWSYIRILPGRSSCMLAEMQFVGLLVPITGPESCDVTVTAKGSDGTALRSATLDTGYSYLAADTPSVASVLPTFGSIAGGTLLTITGVKLDLTAVIP